MKLYSVLAAVMFFSFSAAAVDYVWNGTADGNWEDAANWTPSTGYPSAPDDTATIPNPENSEGDGSSFTVTVNTPFDIASLSVGGTDGHEGKVTLLFKTGFETNSVSGDVVIGNLSTLAHFGPNTTLAHSVVLKSGGDITITSGASVNIAQKGYAYKTAGNGTGGYGPGAGRDNGRYGGETDTTYLVGKVHGSVRRPVDYGGSVCWPGANSAGAVHLIAGGTLTVNGSINACGTKGGSTSASAGGSVWLECSNLVGAGSILAHGGACGKYSGSGGRIAIYQRGAVGLSSFTGSYTTAQTDSAMGNQAGSTCGTIYLEDASDTPGEGTLLIDDRNCTKNASYRTPLNFHMDDSTNVFGRVVVRNRGKLRIVSGLTLKVTKEISVAANSSILTESGGAIEFVGDEEALFTGGSYVTIDSLICTNAGKTIRFGAAAADRLTIPLGKNLVVKGTAESPVVLASATDGTPWQLCVNANAGLVDISHVSVKDSDASYGAGVLAIDSNDLGNNRYWGFSSPIAPGAPITWTGAEDTAWQNTANWNPARAPIATDVIEIPSVQSGIYPVLGAGTFVFNSVSVGVGASLAFSTSTVTVTNSLVVAGALAFSGSEKLYLSGDADFTGGSLVRGLGGIVLVGSGDQTADFGNLALNKLSVAKQGGSVSFGSHGFSAVSFDCSVASPLSMTFAAGEEVSVDILNFLGAIDGVASLTLCSSVPGEAWLLSVASGGASVGGVIVSDSDASGGETILAGTTSVDGSNNVNWDFTTKVALWVGGAAGEYTSGSCWSTGVVPDEDTIVKISLGSDDTATVTLPAGNSVAMRSLGIQAGEGSTASFIANGSVTVAESIVIGENSSLLLNTYNDSGEAPNTAASVHVKQGGMITHTKGGSTENAKIHLAVSGDVVVDNGGTISATGKGYANGKGPGGGASNMTGAGHASYSFAGKAPYGSILRPVTWGSASARNYNGGGAIHLVVSGDLVVNGTVEADGQYSTDGAAYGSCGGSVWIECSSLSGSGCVTARDSYSTGRRDSADTRGSGGRIAVYQRTACDFSAFPKSRILTNNMPYSPPGTVYLESADTSLGTDLYISAKSNNTTLKTVFPMPDDGSDYSIYTNLNIHVGSAAFLSIGRLTGGASVEVRSISIEDAGKVETVAGCNLSMRRGVSVASNSSLVSLGEDSLVFSGDEDATLYGLSKISGFAAIVCTNAGKGLFFGGEENDALIVGDGVNLIFEGTQDDPVRLFPADAGLFWPVNFSATAVSSVKYASISNSNASAGASVLAVNSVDLGGNTGWSFSEEIVPGEVIVWTGSVSTDWTDAANWDRGRVPVETDVVRIPRDGPFNPTLPEGVYLFNSVKIEPDAALTLTGAELTVTNLMLNSGTLVFSSNETLNLTGDAFFTNGTVACSGSYVRIAGQGMQTVDFGGNCVGKVYVENATGPVNFTGHGFTAEYFKCFVESLTIVFEPGELYDFRQCYMAASDTGAGIMLASRVHGSRWMLRLYEDFHSFSRISVEDCDASQGDVAYGGLTSVDDGNNVNWDFSTDLTLWVGGASGDFTDAANWSSGSVPTNTTHVTVLADDGEKVEVTIPATSSASVGSLMLMAGTGGSSSFIAKGPVTVAGDVLVGARCVLTLDSYDDDGPAPNVVSNDVVVYSGGKITHSGPAATENAKLHLAVMGDMTVSEGASVTATQKGHGPGSTHYGAIEMSYSGPHAGWANYASGPYGSIMHPVNWGSSALFMSAGGAIHLVVAGDLTVDGDVSADGAGSDTYSTAGGSVWIECASLLGGGMISARPGDNGVNPNVAYTSSGGRIAVYQREGRDFAAFPKSRILATRTKASACGTVYLESADTSRGADLVIETGNSSSYDTLFPMAADGDPATAYRHVNLVIGKGGRVKIGRGEGDVPRKIVIRSLCLEDDTSRLDLDANFLEVIDPEWKRGRDWSLSATLVTGTYNKVDGEILWLSRGTVITIR